jgi:probable rRNA maturation factor
MLTLTNLTNYRIDQDFLKKAADRADKTAKGKRLKEISLVLVTEAKIKSINRQYRRKNEATDVLSFEGLNEIFICPDFVQKQAKISKAPFAGELMRVLIHGILHLKGYRHEKSKKEAERMERLEEKILQSINGRKKG